MRHACSIFLLAALATAQAPPTFLASRVLPSNGDQPTPLTPGMLYSIYGDGLGPIEGCTGQADPKRLEKPAPNAPAILQRFATQLIYPTELCGVEVTVAGKPAQLLYAQNKQINIKVPFDAPLEGRADVIVTYHRRSSAPVPLPMGLPQATISLERPAHIGGPIWIRVDLPQGWGPVQYPVSLMPDDFGCQALEIRRNGMPLSRLPLRVARTGGIALGLRCGVIGIPGTERTHLGRLPLHVQYRLDQPGEYEVRYTQTGDYALPHAVAILFRSAWTPITLLPAAPTTIPPAPTNPADLMSDFIPNLLAHPDAPALEALEPVLYHPEPIVRRFAAAALPYWPATLVESSLEKLLTSRGPSDAFAPALVERYLPRAATAARYLQSRDPAILAGAVDSVSGVLHRHRAELPAATLDALESSLLAAAPHIAEFAVDQTVTNYAAALGAVHNPKASTLLWDFVQRNIARDQSLIALCWRKDSRDLPRLGALLASFRSPDPLNSSLSSLPYSLRNNFGPAAIPYLEAALAQSPQTWIRTNCARELIAANRPSGFAFVLDAIEHNRLYKLEMAAFVRERFSELRSADEPALAAFLRERAR
ncbi:MAG: hypothetical protein ABI972_24300 [Acidobacteriota bacterium]